MEKRVPIYRDSRANDETHVRTNLSKLQPKKAISPTANKDLGDLIFVSKYDIST